MDKLEDTSIKTFPLPWHGVVALQGTDALKFAQAQLMSDIGAMADGCWHWSGWLTPKGRVIALCAVLRFDSSLLWLVLQDTNADAFAARLQRFVFRSKVTISVRNDLVALGSFVDPDGAFMRRASPANAIHGTPSDMVTLDVGVPGIARLLMLADRGHPDATDHASMQAPVQQAHWLGIDLTHGLPHLSDSPPEQWTPQQLSLDRLRAYSVSKGCYPGQEIVARTHFLGQAKRALVLLQADVELSTGDEVIQGGRVIGTLVSSSRDPSTGTTLSLAVLPADVAADAVLDVSGHPVTQRPLLPGLSR